jgi:hypothetical protein
MASTDGDGHHGAGSLMTFGITDDNGAANKKRNLHFIVPHVQMRIASLYTDDMHIVDAPSPPVTIRWPFP